MSVDKKTAKTSRKAYKKPTNARIIEALRASGGVVTLAADKCGVVRQTMAKWIANNKSLRAACDEITEEMVDIAEAQMIGLVRAGDRESVKFFLRCKGKGRGWNDRIEVVGKGGGPIETESTTTHKIDMSNLSVEEALQMEALVKLATTRPGSTR